MKVKIDTGPLTGGHSVRGIGIYTKNLLAAFSRLKVKNFAVVTDNYDITHYPFFDLFKTSLPFKKDAKTVVTIHDVIPLLYPEAYPKGVRGTIKFLIQKMLVQNVDAVITDSETSKKDIVRFLDIPNFKINVVRLAPTLDPKISSSSSLVIKKYLLPEKFVLYVGDVNYNKNILNLAKACRLAKTTLVIAGKQAASLDFDKTHIENKPLVNLLTEFKDSSNLLRLGFVSDEDLVAIYKLAAVYCQPSLYEGFGLPVLDAFNLGCPVVCSRTQALVEIAEDAALFADPTNIQDLSEKLHEVITNEKTASDLIKKGKQTVKKFTWEKVAQETYAVYKKVLN